MNRDANRWKEDELADMLRKHDPRAIEIMYDQYAPVLFAIALKRTDDNNAAEDILRRTFVYAWKNAAAFHGQNICTWLIGIVRMMICENNKLMKTDTLDTTHQSADRNGGWKTNEQNMENALLERMLVYGGKPEEVGYHFTLEKNKLKMMLREVLMCYRKEPIQA